MLVQIPEGKVGKLCDILRREWPRSQHTISYIETCHRWQKNKQNFDLTLLYDESNIESGVFIGILKSGCVYPVVTVYALDSYEDTLRKELSNCEEICWQDTITFDLITKKHFSILKQVLLEKSFQISVFYSCVSVAMSMEEAEKIEISCPPNVEFRILSADDINGIHERWQRKNLYTVEELKNSLELNRESAIGLFCKETGTLLANCLRAHSGDICALRTAEQARGKGYGKLLVKMATKVLAKYNIEPVSATTSDNEISKSLFHSIGYRIVGEFACLIVRKNY